MRELCERLKKIGQKVVINVDFYETLTNTRPERTRIERKIPMKWL